MLNTRSGFQNLLKEGFRHYAGLEEAILKNIEACIQISNMTKTSIGPNGMKKMVVNHIEKLFVTSDAHTILREIQVHHPAAKMIAMAAQMQEQECGDMTNLVISFAGELLTQAKNLIKMGLHPSDIIAGYESALKETLKFMGAMDTKKISDITKEEDVLPVIKTALCSKLPNYYTYFAKLVLDACYKILPDNHKEFESSNIRVVKILGGSLNDSKVFNGMVIDRPVSGTISLAEKCKIACYSCPFEIQSGETKGTVIIKNASDLLNFTKSEEDYLDRMVKSIADTGVKVICIGGSLNELALHYLEKYELMVLKLTSKWALKRLCKCIGAVAIPALGAPTEEEIGFCETVKMEEIGSDKVTVFIKDSVSTPLVTLLIRGGTKTLLDDTERAIEDGINTFRNLIKDNRVINGGGSTDLYIANYLEAEAEKITSLEQYSYARFAQAFEVIPRHLVNNAGLKTNIVLPELYAKNLEGPNMGVNVLEGKLEETSTLEIYDHLNSKLWAIRLATDAALTILRIDQIIVAKPAGGPKPRSNAGWDND